jgi:hypothetical protein
VSGIPRGDALRTARGQGTKEAMVHEWNRFVFWLGLNAGAIQAVSSIVTAFLTLTLVLVTTRYVRLTNRLAGTALAQLRASLQPDIDCRISCGMVTSEGEFTIHNKGPFSVRIRSVEVQGRVLKQEWVQMEAIDFGIMKGLIVPAGKEISQSFSMAKQVIKISGWPGYAQARCEFVLCTACTDQTGAFEHFYKYSEQQGLRCYQSVPTTFYQSKASPPKPSRFQVNK